MGVLKSLDRQATDALFIPYSVAKVRFAMPDRLAPLAMVTAQPRVIVSEKPMTKEQAKTKGHGVLKKFYGSALAGPDWTRVNGQRWETGGHTVAVVAGYNINRRWAVEGGVAWSKKTYYSRGNYFKTQKLYLPQHSTLLWVDGYCNMFEVPLQVRYNVRRQKSRTWFATAGATSYLMQKEDYDYKYKRYNDYYSGNKVYNKSSRVWMAAGSLSLGLEQRLAKNTSLRLEPYLKIPLRGVGVGQLPLTSTGLLAGITYSIR